MAANRFTPNAPAVAQVGTVTLTGYDATTTYKVACNGKTISVLGQGGTTTTTAAALLAALQAAPAASYPEFAEVTWSALANVVTAVGPASGKPFTFTSSVSGGAGTIGAFTTTTAPTSPNSWDSAANWSLGAVPVNGDDVYLDGTAVGVSWGLNQSAVTLASLNISSTFTGRLGLPEVNADGSGGYEEYRPRYLRVGVSGLTLVGYGAGATAGQGSPLLQIDFGAVQAAVVVEQTGAAAVQGLEPCQLKGTHASNALTVVRGSVAFCGFGGDVGTLSTLTVGYVTSQQGDAQVRVGAGVTLGTLTQSGGVVDLGAGLTTLNLLGGACTQRAGNVTTATIDAGTLAYAGTGTLGTLVIGNNGTVDFTQDPRSRVVTNPVQLYAGYAFLDPFGTTGNPSFVFNHCQPSDGTLTIKIGHTIALS
jgi:hypothetical protein